MGIPIRSEIPDRTSTGFTKNPGTSSSGFKTTGPKEGGRGRIPVSSRVFDAMWEVGFGAASVLLWPHITGGMHMRHFARSLVLAIFVILSATAANSQQPTGFKIRGKATNLPAELFVSGLPDLRLKSSYASNPTFSAAVGLDGTFEF